MRGRWGVGSKGRIEMLRRSSAPEADDLDEFAIEISRGKEGRVVESFAILRPSTV